ncbi:hypothetical protein G4B88_003261 [Cannabis sativa]|uniref:Uncharacterized protein n=1 Tax=Cannabis sativa TaxID=3483 RepID=A0A7J6I6P4_CANSA|nr:hypothetical protein G4B88_003261 [Cannabis sativa]
MDGAESSFHGAFRSPLSEPEIADRGRKLEASESNLLGLADVLNFNNEVNEVSKPETETIGQACDDMQTQNQRLLQRTKRDEYKMKKLKSKMGAGNPNQSASSTQLTAQSDGLGNDGLIPQLLTSVPSLNDAASYLAQTTSFITGCFNDYSVEPSSRDVEDSNLQAHELVMFSSGQTQGSQASSSDVASSSGYHLTHTESSNTEASSSVGDSSRISSSLVQSNQNGQSGISIFQGLINRVRRTVCGSADDIGWMQRDPEMPPVEDGTHRFTETLDSIRHGVHRLPNSMVYLLVPVEKNAREIKEYIEEIYWGSGKRVLLLGHSKGGIDAAAALSLYWPDLKDKVAGLALAQSPYGGSPIASDILREGQLGDYVNLRKLMEILICKVIKGDLQALEDLTYERRREFLKKHHLPRELPVVSFRTEAAISPAVLATLSRVAHAELPMMAPLSAGQSITKLPVVIPLGAAMAACAQLLQIRYGEKSDGLVTCRDAEVPGSIVVRPKRKLDHVWMVYSSLTDDPSEADASQVCEALLTLLVEVGQKKKNEHAMKNE